MEAIWQKKRADLEKENLDVMTIRDQLTDTPVAKTVLDNFINFFVLED